MNTKKDTISKKAKELGFQLIGYTNPIINQKDKKRYKVFLDKNFHGEMNWLNRQYKLKSNPNKLWKNVRTILILGINYAPKENPKKFGYEKNKANISVYARNKDYHTVIKQKLIILQKYLDEKFSIKSKCFVDSSPVMEKTLAQYAGLGWIGKHTNLVSKKIGSWFFLSELFLSEKIEIDNPEINNCGNCTSCLDSCPTEAFDSEYNLDSRKCISYLTIEHKGVFPMSLRKKIGNKIYGCDDCLSVCPWNKFSEITSEKDFFAKKTLINPELKKFLVLKECNFNFFFERSPIKRIGWVRFMRNVIIATGNSQNKNLVAYLIKFLDSEYPILRGASVWSLRQLITVKDFNYLKKKFVSEEKNSYVKFEWEHN